MKESKLNNKQISKWEEIKEILFEIPPFYTHKLIVISILLHTKPYKFQFQSSSLNLFICRLVRNMCKRLMKPAQHSICRAFPFCMHKIFATIGDSCSSKSFFYFTSHNDNLFHSGTTINSTWAPEQLYMGTR